MEGDLIAEPSTGTRISVLARASKMPRRGSRAAGLSLPAVYTLDADQIIYLKHQGMSESVITTMLSHKSVPAKMITASPATAVVAPTVTYIQPATTYYSPAYNDYYPGYYPYYDAWPYPAVSLSFGFGGGYRGGFRGGGGGWHHR